MKIIRGVVFCPGQRVWSALDTKQEYGLKRGSSDRFTYESVSIWVISSVEKIAPDTPHELEAAKIDSDPPNASPVGISIAWSLILRLGFLVVPLLPFVQRQAASTLLVQQTGAVQQQQSEITKNKCDTGHTMLIMRTWPRRTHRR